MTTAREVAELTKCMHEVAKALQAAADVLQGLVLRVEKLERESCATASSPLEWW